MGSINVTVTATNIQNNQVQCTYVPPGPYQIKKGTHDVIFTLDAPSINRGWQYVGTISNTANGQLSVSGNGNSVTVSDIDTVPGDISYNLGMTLNGGIPVWSDPQNHNTGDN